MGSHKIDKLKSDGSNWFAFSIQFISYLLVAQDKKLNQAHKSITAKEGENVTEADNAYGIAVIYTAIESDLVVLMRDKSFTVAREAWKWLEDKFGNSVKTQLHFKACLFTPYTGTIDEFDLRSFIDMKADHRRIFNENIGGESSKISDYQFVHAILNIPTEFDLAKASFTGKPELEIGTFDMRKVFDTLYEYETTIKENMRKGRTESLVAYNGSSSKSSIFDRVTYADIGGGARGRGSRGRGRGATYEGGVRKAHNEGSRNYMHSWRGRGGGSRGRGGGRNGGGRGRGRSGEDRAPDTRTCYNAMKLVTLLATAPKRQTTTRTPPCRCWRRASKSPL
ncbi:MAG: hypothetical protein J3K34DRAFT_442131 [Monoraphidium minutum]|nr:MAG: hypothetical protein J3K34DRAFT_442131 [Monoraphidium minutum]